MFSSNSDCTIAFIYIYTEITRILVATIILDQGRILPSLQSQGLLCNPSLIEEESFLYCNPQGLLCNHPRSRKNPPLQSQGSLCTPSRLEEESFTAITKDPSSFTAITRILVQPSLIIEKESKFTAIARILVQPSLLKEDSWTATTRNSSCA